MIKEKVFSLDSEQSFKQAEDYKMFLENKCFRVIIKTYGLNGIIIKGVN